MRFRKKHSCRFFPWAMTTVNRPSVLYVHVPFCAHICAYCDFCHVAYEEKKAKEWLDALRRQIEMEGIGERLKTLYIGGGTPVSLNHGQLDELLSLFDHHLGDGIEYTVEINPEALDMEKAMILARHGVNRASIGMQSANEGELALLGRKHTASDVMHAVALLRDKGIDNISLDLMYSLPGQTMESLAISVDMALAMRPRHMSLYSLTIEENTVFGKRGYEPLDEDIEADMYEWICERLQQEGFVHYEIANFCQEGYASRHNLAYWTYRDFQGISCGASGKEGNIRYDATRSLREYIGNPVAKTITTLDQQDICFEMAMMNLRLREGMDISMFEKTCGATLEEAFGEKVVELERRGMVETSGGFLRCTSKGYPLLNSILAELL